jgi:N utilization substance protein B
MKKSEARRQSRIWAVEALFSFLEHGEGKQWKGCLDHVLNCVETHVKSVIDEEGIEIETEREDLFAEELVKTAVENLGKIKVIIRVFAPDFPIEKIAPINKALLVLGISEMKFMGTPPVVVINEYIELAKLFAEEKSAGFINAVLDSFRKSLPVDETDHSKENQ